MQINLEINNITVSPINEVFFEMVAKNTFAELDCGFLRNKKVGISIALLAPAEIRKINKEYRKYDKVTDILSFPEYASVEDLKKNAEKETEEEVFLGELILCYDDIKEHAQKEKLDFEQEFAKVVTHGILHLLGFKHGEKMFALQQMVAGKLIK